MHSIYKSYREDFKAFLEDNGHDVKVMEVSESRRKGIAIIKSMANQVEVYRWDARCNCWEYAGHAPFSEYARMQKLYDSL